MITVAIIRVFLLFFWIFFMWIIGALIGIGNKHKAAKRLTYGALAWAKGVALIANLHCNVHGDKKRVKGLIISNHQSYMDIVVLGSIFPLRFTPKKEIKQWPVLGWFLSFSKPIWVDRNSKQSSLDTLEFFKETLANNINLIVFPEGTTNSGENDLLPFKSTLFEVAVNGNRPIFPVIIKYRGYNKELIPWYGDQTLLPHAKQILSQKRIVADVYILDPIETVGRTRKELAETAYNKMNSFYKQV